MISSLKESDGKPRQLIKKQRHHFANKGLYSQSHGFSSSHVWMFDSWTIKKAEHQRIDRHKLSCGRRLLRARWTARRSNLSVLKGISPEHSLEGLMLKLRFQSFGQLVERFDSLGKDPDAGKD